MFIHVYIYNTFFLFFDRSISKYIYFTICPTNIKYNLISNLPYKTKKIIDFWIIIIMGCLKYKVFLLLLVCQLFKLIFG